MKDLNIRVIPFSSNHFIINTSEGKYFQSYESIVAYKPSNGDTITVGGHWDYGTTTKKHLGKWLNMTAKEIKQGIKEGSIIYNEEMK